jgi:DNA-binding FrmR family transcriptional regulator
MQQELKKDVSNRLKSIEGHIRGIQRMVEDDVYCVDIMKQIKAVQGALDRVNALILDSHLQTCVSTAMRSQDRAVQERALTEVVELFTAAHKLR